MWPGTTAVTFLRSTWPRPGIASGNVAVVVSRPSARNWLATHCAAPRELSEPGERSGYTPASSTASRRAEAASNVDSSVAEASGHGVGRSSVNARASSGMATNSQPRR